MKQFKSKCIKNGWRTGINLIIILILSIGFLYFQTNLMDHHLPDHSYHSVRLDSLQREYCRIVNCSSDTSHYILKINGVKDKKMIHFQKNLLISRYKDSIENEALKMRLFMLEESLKSESERIHSDYACYLTKIQTWAAFLIGIVTFITLLISYIVKSDINDKINEYKQNSEKLENEVANKISEHKRDSENLKNEIIDLLVDVREQKNSLKDKLETVEIVNRFTLLLSSIRAVNNDRTLFAAPELKELISSLLFRLRFLNYTINRQIRENKGDENIIEQLQILLLNYLSVISVLEPLVNGRARECLEAFSRFRAFVLELLSRLRQNVEVSSLELNRIFLSIQRNLEILVVEFSNDVREDARR